MVGSASAIVVLSDDSSNDSNSSNSKNNQPAPTAVRAPTTKNIAVKRGTPQAAPPAPSQATSVLKHKRDLEYLHSTSTFLENFNPLTSRREKNKRKQFIGPKTATKKYYTPLYDEQGRLKSTNQDVCDCFDLACVGCHFPCYFCSSQKCSTKCRNNRRFMFEVIEFDGKDTVLTNPLLKSS